MDSVGLAYPLASTVLGFVPIARTVDIVLDFVNPPTSIDLECLGESTRSHVVVKIVVVSRNHWGTVYDKA